MAKAKQQQTTRAHSKPATSRNGYKRKSNRRINPLDDQLARQARKALNRAGAKSFKTVIGKAEEASE